MGTSGNVQTLELIWLKRLHDGSNYRGGCLNSTNIVGREFKNADLASDEVLLVVNVLIRSNEQIKLGFGSLQQIAVLDSGPPLDLHSRAVMTAKQSMHRPWHALIQQNFH